MNNSYTWRAFTGEITGEALAFRATGSAIPTVSEWGVMAMGLLLLVLGSLLIHRRTRPTKKHTPRDDAPSGTPPLFRKIVNHLAIAGAPGHDEVGENSGAVYVFRSCGGSWCEVDKLIPSDAAAGDSLPRSLAADGDHAVVGALEAAYVFSLPPGIPAASAWGLIAFSLSVLVFATLALRRTAIRASHTASFRAMRPQWPECHSAGGSRV